MVGYVPITLIIVDMPFSQTKPNYKKLIFFQNRQALVFTQTQIKLNRKPLKLVDQFINLDRNMHLLKVGFYRIHIF